jgi:Flp pilus assembly secretin CpaC
MWRSTLICFTSLLATAVVACTMSVQTARAAEVSTVSSNWNAASLTLNIGQAVVYDLPTDCADVLVGDPGVATVVAKSNRRAYVIGKSRGNTNVYFYDDEGKQIAGFNIIVYPLSPTADVTLIEGPDWKPLQCRPGIYPCFDVGPPPGSLLPPGTQTFNIIGNRANGAGATIPLK